VKSHCSIDGAVLAASSLFHLRNPLTELMYLYNNRLLNLLLFHSQVYNSLNHDRQSPRPPLLTNIHLHQKVIVDHAEQHLPLTVHNLQSTCIVTQIKSTHPDELELRVFEGSVMPSSQRSITIEIKNVQANRDKKMKLLVQWA
jgi:hypothetical protein